MLANNLLILLVIATVAYKWRHKNQFWNDKILSNKQFYALLLEWFSENWS